MATARRTEKQNARYWALVGRLPDLKGNRVLKGLLDLLDRQDPLDQPHQPQKSRLPSYPAPNVTMTPL